MITLSQVLGILGQHSRFLVKSCLFWLLPSSHPILMPNAIAVNNDGIRTESMGRSFGCSLWIKHILGASLILSSQAAGCRFHKAGLKARFQKGPGLTGWSRALSFATKSTYLLGRRLANLRPAFREVVDTGGI